MIEKILKDTHANPKVELTQRSTCTMKLIKQLQIGDWIRFKESGMYAKVTAVFADSPVTDNFSETIRTNLTDTFYTANSFEPIPITAALLEKNGYHTTPIYDIDDDSIVYNHIDLYGEWTWYNGKIYYSITDEEVVEMLDCKYVHEFQHFLRLRGIENEIVL